METLYHPRKMTNIFHFLAFVSGSFSCGGSIPRPNALKTKTDEGSDDEHKITMTIERSPRHHFHIIFSHSIALTHHIKPFPFQCLRNSAAATTTTMPGPGNNRNPSPPLRRRRSNLLRSNAITFLLLIILVGLAILIFWFVVRPAPLECSVVDASIHGFNLAANELNAAFNLTLRTDNRNHRVGVYYDSVNIAVWYSDHMVAFSEVAPFYQGHRTVTTIEVDAVARSAPLLASVADNLKHDRSMGAAEVEVRMTARIRFKVGLARTKQYTLTVEYCSPVVVHFSSSARFEKACCDVDI